jgi:hypothetical protein
MDVLDALPAALAEAGVTRISEIVRTLDTTPR